MITDVKERTEKKLFIELVHHGVCMRSDMIADKIEFHFSL